MSSSTSVLSTSLCPNNNNHIDIDNINAMTNTNDSGNNSNSSGFVFPQPDPFKEQVIITLAIIRLCLAVFGCLANIVAAVVLTHRKLWSPISMLLLSLVIYDAVYLMLVIPVGATSISVNIHFTPSRYSTLRTIMSLCFPLRSMAQMASTYTTVTVTIERYLVILLPLKASSMWTYGKTRRAIIGILLFSVLFNLPRCFDHILTQPHSETSRSSYSSSSTSTSSPLSLLSASTPNAGNISGNVTVCNGSVPDSAIPQALAYSRGNKVTGNVSCPGLRSDFIGWINENDASGIDRNSSWSSSSRSISGSAMNVTRTPPKDELDSGDNSLMEGLRYFYRVVYVFYLTVIFLYLIPYTLIPVLNLQLILALRRRKEETKRISVKNEHRLNGSLAVHSPTDKEDGLTYIVFGITFCYFICCILPAVYIISAIASDHSNDSTSIYILNAGETTLVINAATDFFFYCLLGRKFRRVFLRSFCPRRYLKKTKAMTMRSNFGYNSV